MAFLYPLLSRKLTLSLQQSKGSHILSQGRDQGTMTYFTFAGNKIFPPLAHVSASCPGSHAVVKLLRTPGDLIMGEVRKQQFLKDLQPQIFIFLPESVSSPK